MALRGTSHDLYTTPITNKYLVFQLKKKNPENYHNDHDSNSAVQSKNTVCAFLKHIRYFH